LSGWWAGSLAGALDGEFPMSRFANRATRRSSFGDPFGGPNRPADLMLPRILIIVATIATSSVVRAEDAPNVI